MKDTRIERNGKTYIVTSEITDNRWFSKYSIYEIDKETNTVNNFLGKRIAMNLEEALNDVLKED